MRFAALLALLLAPAAFGQTTASGASTGSPTTTPSTTSAASTVSSDLRNLDLDENGNPKVTTPTATTMDPNFWKAWTGLTDEIPADGTWQIQTLEVKIP